MSWRCEGTGAGCGGVPGVLPGGLGRLCGVWGSLTAWRAAAALAFAVALWMRSAGKEGSEDEVEDVDEDEDEEEVVVLEDAGCAVMRAVAALWVTAASPAATAGRMEGIFLGPQVGGGWLAGPGRYLGARRADLVGSGRGGRRGAAVFAFWARLGRGPAMREVVWGGVRGGKQFAWASSGGKAGLSQGSGGVCGGRVRVIGPVGCADGCGTPCGGCVRVAGCGGW